MIIWLASYPKSGNTLVRSMLSGIYFLKMENLILIYLKILKNFQILVFLKI